MADQQGYVSTDTGEPITADDLDITTKPLAINGCAKVYVVDMQTGECTPIVAAMLDDESDDAPNLYLYTESA